MRRGQTATVFDECSDMADLLRWFIMFLDMLQVRMPSRCPAHAARGQRLIKNVPLLLPPPSTRTAVPFRQLSLVAWSVSAS
eukprot:366131-Chlamydomonas_euryale.AAC.10